MKMNGFAVFVLAFLLLVLMAACTNSFIRLPIGGDWLSSDTLQQIGIIVDLLNPDKTVNEKGLDDLQVKYGVDVKTPYYAFWQAAKDLKSALLALKDAMGKTRSLTLEEQRLKEALDQLDHPNGLLKINPDKQENNIILPEMDGLTRYYTVVNPCIAAN